ncbi:MAG: orotidine 5'-phosphate decarboxylase, partial [Planctomycetes bacterium]|nr:orotidine 5'-phosphate decarboxylase [Planctomycetota bacterium]
MTHFADRLEAAIEDQGAPICVGIDPHLELIPRSFFEETLPSYENGEDGLCEVAASFCFELLDVLAEAGVRVVKPQVAFFEALGASGMEAYQSICMAAKTHEMVVIADVKRGDIGSTA